MAVERQAGVVGGWSQRRTFSEELGAVLGASRARKQGVRAAQCAPLSLLFITRHNERGTVVLTTLRSIALALTTRVQRQPA